MSKKLLLIGIALLLIIAIPVTLYLVQQQQQNKSQATAATTLAFTPASSQKSPGDPVVLDIMMDPGSNLVSSVNLDITYDATKFEPDGTNALAIDKNILPVVGGGPVYNPGSIRMIVSTGNDPAAVIKSPVKIGTLTLKTLANAGGGNTSVSFGGNTEILSIGAGDSASENVLQGSTPATITINGGFVPAELEPTTPIVSGEPEPTGITPTITVAPTDIPEEDDSEEEPTAIPPTSAPTKAAATTAPTATTTVAPTSGSGGSTIATSTPTPTNSGAVNNSSGFTDGTATPTIAATGPETPFIGYTAVLSFVALLGLILFFAL